TRVARGLVLFGHAAVIVQAYRLSTQTAAIESSEIDGPDGDLAATAEGAMSRSAATILACIAVALPRPAFAYRPFDSTDAAVAEKGNLELELGPLGFLKTGADRFLVTPGAIFNVGIARDLE